MKNLNEVENPKNKANIKLLILLIIILLIVVGVISFVAIDYVMGPKIIEEYNSFTVLNVGGKYKNNPEYWSLEVGEDIPEGYYTINKSSPNPDEEVDVRVVAPKYWSEKAIDNNISLSLHVPFYLGEEYIDNIFLPKGSTVELRAQEVQDITFETLEVANKLNLNDKNKLGVYETSLEKLSIPIIEYNNYLQAINNLKIYSFSEEDEIVYECYSDTCTYDKVDRRTGQIESKEIVLEDEFDSSVKEEEVSLLEKSYIVVQ